MCKENLSINELVEAANRDDRLGLLNDPSAPAGNLNNAIHPIFHDATFLEKTAHLNQALQLASLFLHYDTLLDFFIPLTYGQHRTDTATGKTYLTNPIASKPPEVVAEAIEGVREALHCLEHCVIFRWAPGAQRLWARTRTFDRTPAHSSSCSNAFKYKCCVIVELNEKLRTFYEDEETGYATRSRCDQFRHDFQVAVTLVHEIVHAYGIMRRGTLFEPHIRLDHAETAEWGYAWENFMFGSIINPQDRDRPGTHVQLRKTWADLEQANQCGGKEYCAIPVSWVAQWFRTETWDVVEKNGPLAIPPSTVHIKFLCSIKHHRWIIMTDVPETQKDIEDIHNEAEKACAKDKATCQPSSSRNIQIRRCLWALVDSETLQKSNVPLPTRVPPRVHFTAVSGSSTPAISKRLSVAVEHTSTTSNKSQVTMSSNGSPHSPTFTLTTSKTNVVSTSSLTKRPCEDDSSTKPGKKIVKRVKARHTQKMSFTYEEP